MSYNCSKRKIRGLRRKYNKLKQRINENTIVFPICEDRYWHLSMPCSNLILDSRKVKHRYKQQLVKFLIERVEYLEKSKPKNQFCEVICYINPSNLWNSQIIIFFSKEYYDGFFERNDKYQNWSIIPCEKKFISDWNISNDKNKFQGYREIIADEDNVYESELWFYGNPFGQ